MNTAPLHVLIAEDEAAHVDAIRRAFETAGTKVYLRAVATLREYRACLAEWTPDFALVDLNLPDGRAVEVLTHPPEDAAFPVLVMTAFGNQEIVVEVMKAGALDYVVKSLEAFAAMPYTVERAFREWRLLQEHKQLVAALKRNEAKHGKMMANMGDVLVIIDQDGINRYKSSNIERLFGWRSEEMVDAAALDNVHPDDLNHVREFISALFREPNATGQTECRYRCKDGHYKWIEFRGVNLAHDPDIQGLLGNYHDITERKRETEAAIHLAEAKNKFTSVVSHELRTPLATIKEATNLVLEGVFGPVNDEQKDMLDTAKSNIERLGRLVNNVLSFQKMDAGKTSYDFLENDVNAFVKEANINATLFAGDRKADIMMELGPDLPRIIFDKDKMMQVMFNLIANGIKYSESGPVVIQTRLDKSEIQFSVRDSGQGICPEEMDEIFKPFSQGKGRKKGGTGLGLAITKEIVLAHHGRIWVESKGAGQGSCFYFTLPSVVEKTYNGENT